MPNERVDLWVAATPIGNLGDVSDRLREILGRAGLIFSEDTRVTRSLLQALGIAAAGKRIVALHGQSEDQNYRDSVAQIVARAVSGRSDSECVYLSDAGTPGISDPGGLLVYHARKAGLRVSPLPGPSALTAFLSVLGCEDPQEDHAPGFRFMGFYPKNSKKSASGGGPLLARTLAALEFSQLAVERLVFFESPNRIVSTLKEVSEICNQDGRAKKGLVSIRCVAIKELSKYHERIFEGPVSEVSQSVGEHVSEVGERGEWMFALVIKSVLQRSDSYSQLPETVENWRGILQKILGWNVPLSEAVSTVSQEFGASKNRVYEVALTIKKEQKQKK